MGRPVAVGPRGSTPEAADAFRSWRERRIGLFCRLAGVSRAEGERRLPSLLAAHVAWDRRAQGLVTEHALAAGLVDLDLLEDLRARLEAAY